MDRLLNIIDLTVGIVTIILAVAVAWPIIFVTIAYFFGRAVTVFFDELFAPFPEPVELDDIVEEVDDTP